MSELESITQKLREFAEEREWNQFHSPKNLVMALSVEVSELMEHFQWLTEEQSTNLPDNTFTEVTDEMADVFLYLMRLSDKLGIDIIAAAENKMIKNAKKYPVDASKGRATKYTDLV